MTESTNVMEAVYRGFSSKGTGAKAVYTLKFEVSIGHLQRIIDTFGEYIDNEPQWVVIAPITRVSPPVQVKPQSAQMDIEDAITDAIFRGQPLNTLQDQIDADQEANDHARGELAQEEPAHFTPTTEDQLNAIELIDDPAQERRDWIPPKGWNELKHSQQAGILCKDEGFQEFLCSAVDADEGPEGASDIIRVHCGIGSRRELDTDPRAAAIFKKIHFAFGDWKRNQHISAAQWWERVVNEKDSDNL